MADAHAAHKAAIRRLIDEGINQGNVAVIDELVSPRFVNHGSGRRPISDRDALKRAFRLEKDAFPDLTFTIDDMIAEGDRVMYRGTARGTQAQPFAGIPSNGRSFTIMEIHVMRFDSDGLMVEHWGVEDVAGLFAQLRGEQ